MAFPTALFIITLVILILEVIFLIFALSGRRVFAIQRSLELMLVLISLTITILGIIVFWADGLDGALVVAQLPVYIIVVTCIFLGFIAWLGVSAAAKVEEKTHILEPLVSSAQQHLPPQIKSALLSAFAPSGRLSFQDPRCQSQQQQQPQMFAQQQPYYAQAGNYGNTGYEIDPLLSSNFNTL